MPSCMHRHTPWCRTGQPRTVVPCRSATRLRGHLLAKPWALTPPGAKRPRRSGRMSATSVGAAGACVPSAACLPPQLAGTPAAADIGDMDRFQQLWTPPAAQLDVQARGGAPAAAASSGDDHKPRTPPPDLPSLLLDSRIVYLGMPVGAVCARQRAWRA